jgi:sec-independent protein translocase protein TatA
MYDAIAPLFPAGVPGGTELIVILLIAVLLFGANKIPKLARSTGQAMGEFQKGREQVEQELEQMQEGELDPSEISDSEEADSSDTSSSTPSSEEVEESSS